MTIFELLFLLGVIVALWKLLPKSNRKTPKFGDGLFCDTKMNDRTTDNLNIWKGF